MKQDGFRNRYLIKLSSSVFIAVLNIIIQMLLPRAFTVEEFGYYSYNLNVFTSIVGVAMLSVPTALISKFSKRNEEIGLVLFYLKFYLVMVAVLNIAVIGLYIAGLLQDTFAGQTLSTVLLAMEASIVLNLQNCNIGIFDAMAISRYPAVMQIALKAAMCIAVTIGFLFGKLNLICFYLIQILITGIIAFSMLYEIIKEQKRRYPMEVNYGCKVYFKEFFEFCRPLIISNIISQLLVIFMNWTLMHWAGAVEQAMFGAAWQLNTLVAYVFSPYAELSKREFAVICKDTEAMRHRYQQALKLMIWITSYFAIFIGFVSEWLLPVIYGNKYADAALVTLLMMFYTVYQAWGQLSGSFQLATEKTKVSAVMGVVGQIIMLGFIFLFQIPNFIWPQGLGAIGIALTYLASNLICVNISLIINSRILKMPFIKNFNIQFFPLLLCSITTVALKYGISALWSGDSTGALIGKILIAGIIYTAVVGTVIWMHPQLLGVTRDNLKEIVKKRNG